MITDHTRGEHRTHAVGNPEGYYRSKNMDAKRQALMTQMSKLSGLDFDHYMKGGGRASRATLSRQPLPAPKPSSQDQI